MRFCGYNSDGSTSKSRKWGFLPLASPLRFRRFSFPPFFDYSGAGGSRKITRMASSTGYRPEKLEGPWIEWWSLHHFQNDGCHTSTRHS